MKIRFILPLALLLLCSTMAYSQYAVGLGLVGATSTGYDFEEDSETFGIGAQLKFQYRIGSMFAVAPNFTYYLPSTEGDLEFGNLEANLDFQINVLDNEYNRGYFILGGTYNKNDFTLPATVGGSDALVEGSQERFGGVLGFGIEQTSNFYQEIVVQYKDKPEDSFYKNVQILMRVGYLYNLGKPKETFRKGYEVMTEEPTDTMSN